MLNNNNRNHDKLTTKEKLPVNVEYFNRKFSREPYVHFAN